MQERHRVIKYIVRTATPHPPGWWGVGVGWLSHFSGVWYRRDLGQIGIFGGNWHFGMGDFFRWDLKTPCIRSSEYKSQTKKADPDCNFYNFSLLAPYSNNFLAVCVCIIIVHGIYSTPTTQKYFFARASDFFVSFSYGLGKF